MNYLCVTDAFFPDRPNGAGRVAFDMAQIVRHRGHRVTFFCRKQTADANDIAEYEGMQVVRFAFPKTASLDPLKLRKQIASGTKAAEKHLSGQQWDVIHLHLAPHGHMLYNALGPEQNYIYTAHSPIVDESLANWAEQGFRGRVKSLFGKVTLRSLESDILHKVNRVHTLSQYTKNVLHGRYGIGDKITPIPHWCREDFFRRNDKPTARQKLNWPVSDRIIFTVRRLAPRMGLDISIKAIAPLLKSNADLHFKIAGTGDLLQSLRQLAVDLDVSNQITFMGRVSDEELMCCYEAADLFILPTRALECFGLPVLESLAFGLPLITTDAAAIPELMNPILPNCIVPAGDIGALSEKVSDYLDGRLELPSSQALVEHVKLHYACEVITPRIFDFISC